MLIRPIEKRDNLIIASIIRECLIEYGGDHRESLKPYRGTGIANELITVVLNFAKRHYRKCYLETMDNMDRAKHFYENTTLFIPAKQSEAQDIVAAIFTIYEHSSVIISMVRTIFTEERQWNKTPKKFC